MKTASGYVHLATDQADAKGNYSLQLRKMLVDGTYVIKSYSKEHVHTGNEHFLSVK